MIHSIKDYLKDNRDIQLKELFDFLSKQSISALPEHKRNVKETADWLAESLINAGIENVQVFETNGHPVVYGDWLHAEEKPTVLVYGHYDVQPVDPLNLWESPPFEPQIRDKKIYARGASDDKGQVFMHIKAVEAILKSTNSLPINIKFCLEGEEEIGSPHLPKFVEENKEKLKADVIVISDTSMMEKGKPTICYGLRGLCGLQINMKGPKGDLHSGLFGGAVQNPITALVELLSTFHNKDGIITVDGFYNKVESLTDEEKAAYEALNLTDDIFIDQTGVPALYGEKDYSTLERMWVRPTLEFNGIYGGFQGDGIKTVIPSTASCKLTCRLVPNQDPDEIVSLLKTHIENNTPSGVTIDIEIFDKGAPFVTPFDHVAIQTAGQAYEEVYGVPTSYTRGGGSVPIVAVFDEILNLPVVLMGFGLPDENFHAPNEHFHLENYDKGLETLCTYWFKLSDTLK